MTVPTSFNRLDLIDAIYQGTSDLVYVLASDGTVLDANRSALAFTELTLEKAIGLPLWTTPGWARHPELSTWLQQGVAAGHAEIASAHQFTSVATAGERRVRRFTLGALAGAAPQQSYIRVLAHDITVEEQTIAALRESKARFLAALDAAGDALVLARAKRDASGAIAEFVIIDTNGRASELAGETREALRGRMLLDVFPKSRDAGLWEQCCQVVETRAPLELTQSAPIPGVPGHWIRRHIVPLGDGVAISSRDLTRREQERALLEASEARYRKLYEESAAIQLIVDDDTGALIDVNPTAEAFYGWPRATMRSMFVTDLDGRTPDAWRAEVSAKSRAGIAGRPVAHVHRVANGERREVEIAASPLDLSGRATRHLIVHDVSDRARAEAQLRESEARFRAVVDGMSEGVVVHDATGAIREFNPEAERILGLTAAQLRGLDPVSRDWMAVHEDGTPWHPIKHPAMEALRTGLRQPRVLMGIRRGGSEHVWLQVVADPLIRDGEDAPYGAVAVFYDVTLQRNAEERLRQAQKLEAVGQLAGGIAHDFNNLLTVIRGAASFLGDSIASDSPQQDDVRAIERATERAAELTRRLLAVGRRQLLRPERVDLGDLLQEQFPTIRDESPRSIRVELALSEHRAVARLDRRKLLDALRALVDNARSAMPKGGALTLSTDVRDIERSTDRGHVQRFAMLEVRDTGEGMSEEVRARLFEPFFSTQPFGANHGMGLASVHGMVAQSSGFVECDSALGQGTALRLFFPLATESERVIVTPYHSRAISGRGVLLVDDDPLLRDLAGRMLERLGHSAAVVESGPEALALLASGAVQLSVMVTDLTMPGMSGMELIAEVQRRYPNLPIVAISGFSMNPAVLQVLADRQVPFVGKPFSAEELERAMDQALAEKASTADKSQY